ncbi:MAG: hypothetical protein LBJ69_02330 [Holosporales bacterium]|jgi:hypothetical protein|nr:hypothetical protein [Holosporales bacterium]
MFVVRKAHSLWLLATIGLIVAACGILPETLVWLQEVDFEVDPKANNGNAFSCHIVVACSNDLCMRLQTMDAKGYFQATTSLEKTYKDSIEIFKIDLVPGRDRKGYRVDIKSRTKAKAAFLFAKYLTPGKFMENVGVSNRITVRFLPNKMEVHHNIDLEALTKKLGNG